MNLIYYENPYLKSIRCRAVRVVKTQNETLVYLDSTIFYPEGGGQEGDIGTLGEYNVICTTKEEGLYSVIHLDSNADIKEGDVYSLVLDWEHRYKYMAMHTCQHLLSGLLYSMFDIGTLAVHLGDDYITIEVNCGKIQQEKIEKLIEKANKVISENHRVTYREMSYEDALSLELRRSIKVKSNVRIVEIEGVDVIACGGVHVASTGEIRAVCYTGSEHVRGNERLFFKCRDDAIALMLNDNKYCTEIARILTCSHNELVQKISVMNSDIQQLQSKLIEMQRQVALNDIQKNINNSICTIMLKSQQNIQIYASCAREFADIAMFVLCPSGENWQYVIVFKGKFEKISFDTVKKEILDQLESKGGGRSPVFQGICKCKKISDIQKASEKFISYMLRV